jgi:hypothetical protein
MWGLMDCKPDSLNQGMLMKKGIMSEPIEQKETADHPLTANSPMSEELQIAIQDLIKRLRERGSAQSF